MMGVSYKDFENTVSFVVDTGRCGANFIIYVLRLEGGVPATKETHSKRDWKF